MDQYLESVLNNVKAKNPAEPEFQQAMHDFLISISPALPKHPQYAENEIIERLIEPERFAMFRVPWADDRNKAHINRGFLVQFSSALGTYAGGLRFHPAVDLGLVKFLAFKQLFRNALTTLPLGAAAGGADFDPKGKSESEIRRFCHSFMTELYNYLMSEKNILWGEIGVGEREISYLSEQYKKLSISSGGSPAGQCLVSLQKLTCAQASGYGVAFFIREMLATLNDSFKDKRVAITGSGNLALKTAEKVNQLGGKVITLSDSRGYIIDAAGLNADKLAFIAELKSSNSAGLSRYVSKFPESEYHEGSGLHNISADIAILCATQHELNKTDANALIKKGYICVAEGAHSAATREAVAALLDAGVIYGPGKAAAIGGAALCGLSEEISNLRLAPDEIENRLAEIMKAIYGICRETSMAYGFPKNYLLGADIASFLRIADAMLTRERT